LLGGETPEAESVTIVLRQSPAARLIEQGQMRLPSGIALIGAQPIKPGRFPIREIRNLERRRHAGLFR
jgi:hypothetical protein